MSGGLAALALGACTAGALGGCGSSKPASASAPASTQTTASTPTASTPTTTTSTSTSTPSTTTAQTSTSAGSAPASGAGGTAAPSTTRTAPEPAFAEAEQHAGDLQQALGVLQARGYTAGDTSEYHASQTLRVLVGTKAGSTGGYEQQAFFFVDGHYIGTDTKEPSATVEVVSQNDTEVTLAYSLYRSTDAMSSPSGGKATVRFALNDGKLTALDPIPPATSATSSTGLSRR
ncbi:MAG TPA: LppP/LprE family lipoprotein [Solirubrobacteraceae bacterium]|nr:LppP/LprE family lipoprotein [Solirubrobacteraceae bacterium]